MTTGWDWNEVVVGLLLAGALFALGSWLWGEVEASRVRKRCKTPDPAPRLRVLPGGES